MRFLLRPGWIAFVLVVIAFAVACYTLLAPWQFRRNAEQQLQNEQIAASYAHPPLPLGELVAPGTAPNPALQWRQVLLRGSYLPEREAVVRLRTVEGNPASEVLTAFRTDDGRTVAVDRGYVRPGDDGQVAAYPAAPSGPVALTARLRVDENDPRHRPPIELAGHTQIYAADSRILTRVTGTPVAPGYLQLVEDQPGGLAPLPLPDTDSGPFLSYAWQWLSFGAMALFGLVYFIRLELLQRRDPDAGDGPGDPRDPEPPVDPARAPARGSARDVPAAAGAVPDGTAPPDTARDGTAPDRALSERDRLAERYGGARF